MTTSTRLSMVTIISLSQEQMLLVKTNPKMQTDPLAFLEIFARNSAPTSKK